MHTNTQINTETHIHKLLNLLWLYRTCLSNFEYFSHLNTCFENFINTSQFVINMKLLTNRESPWLQKPECEETEKSDLRRVEIKNDVELGCPERCPTTVLKLIVLDLDLDFMI